MTADLEADLVIVGGGSAGCLLANRLSADASLQVLLIEAGDADRNPWIRVPMGYARTIADPAVNWCYRTDTAPSLAGRALHYPLGKTLGGSSAINGLVWVHGQGGDYDDWGRAAGPDWGRTPMRQALRAVEAVHPSIAGDRGRGAGVAVVAADTRHPLMRATLEAGVSSGLQANPDYNAGAQGGIGPVQVTIANGQRVSAAHAFLHPIRARHNLRVLTSARVRRVLWDGLRATGVEIVSHGGGATVRASRQVVLSAGAIHTPQLLMASGVGPARDLERLGVPTLVHAPEVGQNLQDHVQVRCVFEARGVDTLNQLFHSPVRKAWAGLRYFVNRSGWLSQGALRVVAFARSHAGAACPDLQLFFAPLSADQLGSPPHRFPGLSISVVPMKPQSRGTVSLRSADPAEAPRIHLPLLEHPQDLSLMRAGIGLARRIAAQPALAPWLVREVHPGVDKVSDEDLGQFARQQATTIYHPVGSCRMGSDSASVVDPYLRVRGVENLRVVDASIMPTIVSGNTNAATLALAERASALILSALQRQDETRGETR